MRRARIPVAMALVLTLVGLVIGAVQWITS